MHIEGIESIETMDIDYATELGYKIKHIALAKRTNSQIECRAHPVLIHQTNILSNIDGVMNAVRTQGDRFGTSLLYGHGAGGKATASAVISNITDYCNYSHKGFGHDSVRSDNDKLSSVMSINDICSQYYLRMFANDVPGVMAEVTSCLLYTSDAADE